MRSHGPPHLKRRAGGEAPLAVRSRTVFCQEACAPPALASMDISAK
ncbi:hypothetical protein SF83666_b57190 (plasmid) [Sinorhizobium fredii CCBAU 83666]|nr:hypothetical protein SF83666_b57190 [Sinorhizobium fredii CCBAU 83666]